MAFGYSTYPGPAKMPLLVAVDSLRIRTAMTSLVNFRGSRAIQEAHSIPGRDLRMKSHFAASTSERVSKPQLVCRSSVAEAPEVSINLIFR